eukprot:GILJ01009351.1.p1 GENE.GILJ01009351.1~~GILJ01009351.1.p1  ORF type:complete len:426 (-),score=55.03 GILJ01009351.1:103-1380(-)
MSEHEEDDHVYCAKCHEALENALMMSCDHNLCLTCAAKNLQMQLQTSKQPLKIVVCELCRAETVLEHSSAEQLLMHLPSAPANAKFTSSVLQPTPARSLCSQCERLPVALECVQCDEFFCSACGPSFHRRGRLQQHSLKVLPAAAPKTAYNASNEGLHSSHPGTPRQSSASSSGHRQRRPAAAIVCRDHPDEEVTYFCLDCECSCICTECVVHGVHRNHEVQNLRRAFPIVKAKVEDLLFHLTSRMEDLSLMDQRIENHRREIVENTQTVKQQMAKAFEEIRQRIDKKERELMQNADIFMDESIAELDVYIRASREKTYELDASADVLRRQLEEKDEISLLNFYASNKDRIHNVIQVDQSQLQDLPSIASRKCFLHTDSTNAHIDALHGLHLSIAALRGLEDTGGDHPRHQEYGGSSSPSQRWRL